MRGTPRSAEHERLRRTHYTGSLVDSTRTRTSTSNTPQRRPEPPQARRVGAKAPTATLVPPLRSLVLVLALAPATDWIDSFLQGNQALEEGRLNDAREAFGEVLEERPRHASTAWQLAGVAARSEPLREDPRFSDRAPSLETK